MQYNFKISLWKPWRVVEPCGCVKKPSAVYAIALPKAYLSKQCIVNHSYSDLLSTVCCLFSWTAQWKAMPCISTFRDGESFCKIARMVETISKNINGKKNADMHLKHFSGGIFEYHYNPNIFQALYRHKEDNFILQNFLA